MVKYQESLDNFKTKFIELMKYYSNLADKAPLTEQYLTDLTDFINEMYLRGLQRNEALDEKIKTLDLVYQGHVNEYNKKKREYDLTLKSTRDAIAEKYVNKTKEEKNNISILKKNNKYTEGNIKQDIYFYLTSSSQKLTLLEQEYNENKNRFDYQVKQANETYEDNIRKRDIILDGALINVKAEYNDNLVQFDEDCKSILAKLNNKISKLNSRLTELETIEQGIENKHKAQARQESIEFNALIKKLQENKNKEIVEAKDNYTTSLNEDNIEKENKHKLINDEIQQVMKEFVSKINSLDERLSKLKLEYQNNYKKLQQSYFYELIEINKKQTLETKAILNDVQNLKWLFKGLRKKYYLIQQTAKNKIQNALKSLEIEYHENLETIRHERALAELIKNKSIKKLSETEQSTNKHYQEQSNIYENRMNLDIFMANSKYNQEANKYKCESRKRSIVKEKEYTDSLLRLRKDIKATTTDIKKIEISIQCVNELNKLLHDEENKTFNKRINYLSVDALLEIEKHKALKIYNDKQYEYNLANALAVLDYSKDKISIQNKQYEVLNHATIEINKAKMDREITNINHHIVDLGIEELEEQTIQARNLHYELDSSMHNTLKNRFNYEIVIINQITSTLILQIKDIEELYNFVINKLYNDLKIREEYIGFLQFFIDDFSTLIENYHNDLCENYLRIESKIIDERLAFEESFKFKEGYARIEDGLKTDSTYLNQKRDEATNAIMKGKTEIDIANSRIASMYNQIEHVKNSNKSSETKQKEIHQLKIRISVLKTDISKKQERITVLYQNIETIDKDIRDVELRYKRQDKELKELQFNSAKSFHNLRNAIDRIVSLSKIKLKNVLHPSPDSFSYNTIKSITHNLTSSYEKTNFETFSSFYEAINKFSLDTIEAISRDKRLLLYKFRNDLMLINEDISRKFNNNHNELNEANEKSDASIYYLEKEYKSKEAHFKNQLDICDKAFKDKCQEILNLKEKATQQFYSSFYAVDDNSNGINDNYKEFIDKVKNDFLEKKNRLIYNEATSKENLASELNQYIIQNDESINHLPEASKLQTMEIDLDTKNRNRDIDLSVVESREKFHSNQKSIHKNIDDIKSTLDSTISEIESTYQQDLRNENKAFFLNTRRISKGFLEARK